MKGIWKMQNYRYRSSGNSRGCMRQPDSSRELCAGIALDQMPVTMAYVPGRNGEIFMRLKKDYEEELFFRIWINLSVE
jgi:hypothetical protein